jgi:hypothetical protein
VSASQSGLFIYGLFNEAVSTAEYITTNGGSLLNFKGFGRKLRPNLRYFPTFVWWDCKNTKKNLKEDSRFLS